MSVVMYPFVQHHLSLKWYFIIFFLMFYSYTITNSIFLEHPLSFDKLYECCSHLEQGFHLELYNFCFDRCSYGAPLESFHYDLSWHLLTR
jgi:hypothetical protein